MPLYGDIKAKKSVLNAAECDNAGVAVVRDLVRECNQALCQDHRLVQQPLDQGAQAARSSTHRQRVAWSG